MDGLIEGRIVHYILTQNDVDSINQIRTDAKALGANFVMANGVNAGQHVPMMVVQVWDKETGYINGKVFLDGSFDYWVTSVLYSEEPKERTWHWIERA